MVDGLAVHPDLARVGPLRAREHLHEGRLPGAVATDEADDLAGVQIDAHVRRPHARRRTTRGSTRMSTSGTPVGGGRRSGRGCRSGGRRRGHRFAGHRALLRRTQESKPTAPTSTMPTTMSWIGESTLSRSMPGAQRLHHDRAQDRARDRPDAARERRAADDRGGDDVQLGLDAQVRVAPFRRAVWIAALTAARMPISDEREHDRAADVDAAELGGLRVAADREDVPPELPSRRRAGSSPGRRRSTR